MLFLDVPVCTKKQHDRSITSGVIADKGILQKYREHLKTALVSNAPIFHSRLQPSAINSPDSLRVHWGMHYKNIPGKPDHTYFKWVPQFLFWWQSTRIKVKITTISGKVAYERILQLDWLRIIQEQRIKRSPGKFLRCLSTCKKIHLVVQGILLIKEFHNLIVWEYLV